MMSQIHNFLISVYQGQPAARSLYPLHANCLHPVGHCKHSCYRSICAPSSGRQGSIVNSGALLDCCLCNLYKHRCIKNKIGLHNMQTKITLKKQISTYCQWYIIILYCSSWLWYTALCDSDTSTWIYIFIISIIGLLTEITSSPAIGMCAPAGVASVFFVTLTFMCAGVGIALVSTC